MPIQIKCGGCGTVLAEFNDLPLVSIILQGKRHVSPSELVIKQNDGKCPSCGKRLETNVNKQQVDVSAFNPYVEPLLEVAK